MSEGSVYRRSAMGSVLLLGALFSCGQSQSQDGGFLVNLSNLPARTTKLSVNATLDGKPAMQNMDFATPLSQFGVVPSVGAMGDLMLTILAFDSDGCLQASGQLDTTLTGKYSEQQVALVAQSPRMCGSLAGCAAGTICTYPTSPANVNLSSIWASSPTNIWAVGDSGVALHYDGKSWQTTVTPTVNNLKSVWGSSATDIWAVGASGTIIHNDGQTWTTSTNLAIYDLMGVYGVSTTDVWAVGMSSSATTPGEFWHWDGTSWKKVTTGISGSLYSVWASSTSDITAGGIGGLLIHYDGSTAVSVASGTTSDLHSIWGSSRSLVFAGGSGGTVIRNVGTGWKPVTVNGYAASLYGIGGDGTTIYGVGNPGAIGNMITGTSPFDSFNVQSSGNSTYLSGVTVGSNGIAWVTGKLGYLGYFDTRP